MATHTGSHSDTHPAHPADPMTEYVTFDCGDPEEEVYMSTANKTRLRLLALVIERNPKHLDLDYWARMDGVDCETPAVAIADGVMDAVRECRTKACIAGWAVALWPEDVAANMTWVEAAAEILGLDIPDARTLCYATWLPHEEVPGVLRDIADGYDTEKTLRAAAVKQLDTSC